MLTTSDPFPRLPIIARPERAKLLSSMPVRFNIVGDNFVDNPRASTFRLSHCYDLVTMLNK
jgi:hypothetical protein